MNEIIKSDIKELVEYGKGIWQYFENKTILLTGASGLIPYYFLATFMELNNSVLKGKGCHVLALVRNIDKAKNKLSDFISSNYLNLIVQDVSLPLNIKGPVDVIIHAASQASPKYYSIDPVGTMSANILGTYNLLNLAVNKKSSKFLFLSGGEIYGILPEEKIPTKEADYGTLDSVSLRSCYAESKRAGETLCVAYNKQYSINTFIARLAHTYGPGISLDDGRVFADFVRDVVESKDITIKGDGKAERSFCYVSDAVLGMFILMLKGNSSQAYNVCNDKACVSIRELAERISNIFPERSIKFKLDEKYSSSDYMKSPVNKSCLDSSKLKKLGWEPKISIEEGFRRMILSYLI